MWGGLWSFTILAATLFLLKLIRRYHRFRLNSAVGIIGVIISAILFLPMIVTPSTIPSMNSNFASAFGSDWETQIPSEIQQQHFLTTRFNVGAYYFGMSPKPCNIIKDISFYNGTSGVDDGIRLYFDAYLPLNNGIGLPGANSTLIRIHGGGWAIGDKGTGNMLQMNEYFASQGYCVFDIQYGITTQLNFMESMRNLITPANVMGNFTIADMIRHIGIFCQYLTAHATEYGANLNSTFISGGSAGGHLTCAAGLAIASGNYTSWFGDKINLRGIVPFYPANREATFDKITPQELIDPSLLITDQSPACLIFQGLSDGLVVPHLAQDFKDAYTTANNPRCAVIWMPFSSHGSDLDFSGYYNQIFLYYMERFLYLYR
jgi:acetyl esterase/lipase